MSATDRVRQPLPLPPYRSPAQPSRQRTMLAAFAAAGGMYGGAYCYFFPYLLLELLLPLVFLALTVIWALPDTQRAPTGTLGGLFFFFFVGAIVWPDYLALSAPGLPWITLRRIIAVPMLVVFLICLSTSPQVREQIKASLGTAPMITKFLGAFIVTQIITIPLSRDLGLSIDKFIVAQLYWTLPFFIGCYVFRHHGSVARWSALLVGMLLVLALIGLWESSLGRVPWAGRIPGFLVIEDEVVQRILSGATRAASGIYRVQSTFTTSLGYAEYMALTMPFLVHYAIGPFRPWLKFLAIAAIPLTFYMIMLTDSRLGMVGFFLSFLFYLALWGARRWVHNKDSLFGPAIVLAYPVVFALFVVATQTIGRLRTMVWGGGQHSFSTESRLEQYSSGMDILLRNPFGHGAGMGAETLGFTNLAGVLTIDTYYLAIALEYGVLGFIAYYGLFIAATAYAGRAALRADERDPEQLYLVPIAIALANYIVIKSIFSQESNHPIAFMLVAMVLALASRTTMGGEPRQAYPASQPGFPRWLRSPANHPDSP